MIRKKKIYFIIGEHKSLLGIKSFLIILKKILSEYNIIISSELKPKAVNILVENFSKKDFVQIKKLKEQSSFKIILVTTEFFNHKINSFNCFDIKLGTILIIKFLGIFLKLNIGMYIILRQIIHTFKLNIGMYIILRKIIHTFKLNIGMYTILRKIILTLMTSLNIFNIRKITQKNKKILKPKLTQIFEKAYRYLYFKRRYKYYRKIIPYADLVMASHEEIYNECKKLHDKIFYIFPKISKFKPNKNVKKSNFFKFSGYMGKDRKFFFKTFYEKLEDNLFINKNGLIFLKNFLKKIVNTKANSFIDISKKNKYKFSLHPQREKIWRFSSPIRYIDALNNGEIPIVFKNFNDKISKNLSILVNIKSKKSLQKLEVNSYYSNLKKLKKGINEYNSFVARDNIRFKSELKKLIKENYKYYTNCS